MAYPIELMVAIGFLVMGLSMLFRTSDWQAWILHLQAQGHNTSLVLGSINLLLGSFIVAFHWVWEGVAMIVTIFGILFLCRSVVLLFCPAFLPKMLKKLAPRMDGLIMLSGLVITAVAVVLFYDLYGPVASMQ